MERKELEFVLRHNAYLHGGTKEACVKVRDYLAKAKVSQNEIEPRFTDVTAEEFVEAVKTLMAFAFKEEDTIPERWQCDNDCHRVSYLLCPGECLITTDSDASLCPYFMDEGFI